MAAIIDLYAGVGGMSLGAARAGFTVSSAVELDPRAIASHHVNFPNSRHFKSDVSTLAGQGLLRESQIADGGLSGLIGGPPCQGFSSIGRRAPDDLRNNLFGHFFRLVRETQPAFYLAENVTGILQADYEDLRTHALAQVGEDYVKLPPFRIRASDVGAPTVRTRVFFFGYRPERFTAGFTPQSFLPGTPPKTVVRQALDGMPSRIFKMWQTPEQGWRPVEAPGSAGEHFHQRVIDMVPAGVGDVDAVAKLQFKRLASGSLGTNHSPVVKSRYQALAHGECDRISKSVRLDPEGFCPTLRAGTAADKGSYQAVRPIHFSKSRVITPREAARLQGFPDWFQFHDTKWHSFRQIGNSVSPLVAEHVLGIIRAALRDE